MAALIVFGAEWAVVEKSPLAALLLPPIGVVFLVLIWPVNAIWLACMIGFSLLHRACLGWLEKRYPAADVDRVRGRSIMIGAVLGLSLAVVACLVSVQLHLPGPYEDMDDDVIPPVYASTVTLLMYGVSAWVASIVAGGALGWLWARRAAARKP